MKRVITTCMAALMTFGLLTGCTNSGKSGAATTPAPAATTNNEATKADQNAEAKTTEQSAEAVPCKFLVPGDEPTEGAAVLSLINERMASDNVGVNLAFQYIPWDAWDQKINLMLSTGEEFDMFHVMNDRVSLSNYAARNALADITEEMNAYGENIKKYNPDIMMKAGQVGGKQYAIPAYWVEFSIDPQITIRKDIMREYGITEMPKSFTELLDAYEVVMKNWKGVQKPYLTYYAASSTGIGADKKTYSTWPYIVVDNMIYVNQDGTIKSYFETEEFKKACDNAREMYNRGLINPDVLTYTNDQLNSQLNSGDWFIHFGTYGGAVSNLQTNYPNLTVEDFGFIDFAPEKPNVRPYGTRNMNAVPLSSKNPAAPVKLVNWIYANQANYDLFMYGRENVDFKPVEPRNREDIVDPVKNVPLYSFADWMIGNVQYLRPALGSPTITNEILFNADKNAVDSIAASFTFDASNVQTQYADVKTQISAVVAPMGAGVKDYESNIDNALSLLKKAGIDDIVNEYKAQFEAFKANNQ